MLRATQAHDPEGTVGLLRLTVGPDPCILNGFVSEPDPHRSELGLSAKRLDKPVILLLVFNADEVTA